MLVSALEGGHINLPAARYLEGASKTDRYTVPSLAFLLAHSKTGTKVVFDLGLRKDIESFPPLVQQDIRDIMPVKVEHDVLDSLRKGGVTADDIRYIILSHLHFDQSVLRFLLPVQDSLDLFIVLVTPRFFRIQLS